MNHLQKLVRNAIYNVVEMSDDELMSVPAGSDFVFDVECYINFFYIAFKCLDNGKYVTFEQSPDFKINPTKLRWVLWRFRIISFNGINYDIPIIEYCLRGKTNLELKQASDFIILNQVRSFEFEREFKLKIGTYNHVDLIEVAPLQGSLKLYTGRLHCKRMQDLPYPPETVLTAQDAETVRPYCANDLENTELLFNHLKPEIDLRCEMSTKYGIDLRSKSDAQVAEAVINNELKKVLGFYPKKPKLINGLLLKYNTPDFIKFESKKLQEVLSKIENCSFELDGQGSPLMPKDLEKLTVSIGGTCYKIGMGGLHSQEKSIAHIATDEILLEDDDVESFYPRIILNQRLFPSHLGEAFLTVYNSIVNSRLDAKHKAKVCKKSNDLEGAKHWKKIADCLKIVINGSFGKLGNKHSTLYAPQLMLQVTLTGQLVLLMLIEMMEKIGIPVVSGNTDGIILKYNKDRYSEVKEVIKVWESNTDFKTEETNYKAVYSRDVNNYIAIKKDDCNPNSSFLDERLGCKTKGTFSERGSALNSILSKNPEAMISTDAVLQFITNKVPLEETILNCKKIERFLSVRNVKGGGEFNGVYLGKVVRWYYSKNNPHFISYVGSGNKVAKTDGAKPLMDLPEELPNDIDYDWYIKEATSLLEDCGCISKIESGKLFF